MMNTVFASATALLAPEFIEKFSIERLTFALSRVKNKTGARIDRSTNKIIIVGRWDWILESHDILLEEFRNLTCLCQDENTIEYDDSVAEQNIGELPETFSDNSLPLRSKVEEENPYLMNHKPDLHIGDEKYKPSESLADFTKLLSNTLQQSVPSKPPMKDFVEHDHIEVKVERHEDSSMDTNSDPGTVHEIDQKEGLNSEKETEPHSKQLNEKHLEYGKFYIRQQELDLSNSNESTPQTLDLSCIIKHEVVNEEKSSTEGQYTSAIGKVLKKRDRSTVEIFSCDQCDYTGKDKSTLKAHRRRRHVKNFTCDKCDKSFGYNKDLNRHKQTVHVDRTVHKRGRKKTPKDPNETFQCTECPYVGKEKSLLREHKRRQHDIRFQCDQCDRSFGFNKDLNRHKRQVHVAAEYLCDKCKKLFKTKRALCVHSKCHQEDYVRLSFQCQICDKKYSTKYVLDNHVKAEHLGMKKSYLCPICGRSFTQKGSYRQHANVHAGIRPYVCDICGKTFSYENGLKAHKFLHSATPTFHCNICSKSFLQKNSLRIHMKVHQETGDNICTYCGRTFSQKQSLIRHERIHSGAKPYLCSLCLKTFRDASIIRRHMILIHKKDPKKWREGVVNKMRKSETFFIDVLTGDSGIAIDKPCSAEKQDIYKDIKHLPAVPIEQKTYFNM